MARFEIVSKYKDKSINLPKRKTQFSAGYDFEVAADTIIPPFDQDEMTYSLALRENDKDIQLIAEEVLTEPVQPLTLQKMATFTKKTKIKPTLVPTGIKAKLDPYQYLELSVRSSCPLKYWLILANGVGIIDSDYYNNPDNEGEIFFQIINLSPFFILLQKGETIGQGIIKPYNITEDDNAAGTRTGGFGSTNE